MTAGVCLGSRWCIDVLPVLGFGVMVWGIAALVFVVVAACFALWRDA
jgi:hypothetical protein